MDINYKKVFTALRTVFCSRSSYRRIFQGLEKIKFGYMESRKSRLKRLAVYCFVEFFTLLSTNNNSLLQNSFN